MLGAARPLGVPGRYTPLPPGASQLNRRPPGHQWRGKAQEAFEYPPFRSCAPLHHCCRCPPPHSFTCEKSLLEALSRRGVATSINWATKIDDSAITALHMWTRIGQQPPSFNSKPLCEWSAVKYIDPQVAVAQLKVQTWRVLLV